MRVTSLRFADLKDESVLRELLDEPESNFVERKRVADARTLAKVITGFANAEGGWLLLGVDDDGRLPGWQSKGTAHPRDWLRDILDNEVEDLPVFEADIFEVADTTVGVVRVPRSVDAPHWLEDGSCWERRNGQTKRTPKQRVRELTLRSGGDREAATARLDNGVSPDMQVALDAPRDNTVTDGMELTSIVRVSLLDPREAFAEWVFEPAAMGLTGQFLYDAALQFDDRQWTSPSGPMPASTTAGGHTSSISWEGRTLREAHVAWDKRGLGGVRLTGQRPDASDMYYLLSVEHRDRHLLSVLTYLLDFLQQADAYGPAWVRWDLYGVRNAEVATVLPDGRTLEAQGRIPAHHHNAVALDVPADIGVDSPEELALRLWTQLERLAGVRGF